MGFQWAPRHWHMTHTDMSCTLEQTQENLTCKMFPFLLSNIKKLCLVVVLMECSGMTYMYALCLCVYYASEESKICIYRSFSMLITWR